MSKLKPATKKRAVKRTKKIVKARKKKAVSSKPRKPAPVIGGFSKGVSGAVSINFATSGGGNCDKGCRHLGVQCYAQVIEARADRVQLANKLERHETTPAHQIVYRALSELQTLAYKGRPIPWVRVSTAGSVPQVSDITPQFVTAFRTLLTWCKGQGIPVHVPVETTAKADEYRRLFGELVVIRASLQSANETTEYGAPCSMVAGDEIKTGTNIRRRRVDAARAVAKQRYETTGRKTIVCPAVSSGWEKRAGNRPDSIKCGQCTACSLPQFDIVYPQH